jgi:cytochrome c-type biogenesis protein CcmH
MKIFKIFLLMILHINIANANNDIKDKNLNNKILKNIRCLVCQGQSVYDSESEFSSTIKLLVKKKINEGKSEKQIYEFLRERYGDWVIFEPELNKNTYILWLLPLLLFLLGGAIMIKKLIFKN